MAELNLKQIIDRLNKEFTGGTRKIVFWYDDRGDFEEDIDSIELENAKVYRLYPDNQFHTKRFLEREDKETNYLIYAPFPKPDVTENHLEDMLLYSKRFYADRASLLSLDLGIEEKYKSVIEKHIKFFGNKERTKRFYDLEIENFNEVNIYVGLLSAIVKTKICSFDEVVRIVLSEGEFEDNSYIQEMEKYELDSAFWKLCEMYFGYMDEEPSLERFVVTLFVTYADRYMGSDVPKAWTSFVSMKQGSIVAFMENLINNVVYSKDFDRLSDHVARGLNLPKALGSYDVDELLELNAFRYIDVMVADWINERLLSEDLGAKLGENSIPEVCDIRLRMHFGSEYEALYKMLKNAYRIISEKNFESTSGINEIVKSYEKSVNKIDRAYRKFYLYYDVLDDDRFESLQTLVENIYTNEYLDKIAVAWNKEIGKGIEKISLPMQRDFYNGNVRTIGEKTVVIISDAMRYEVGAELFEKLSDDPRCNVLISSMLSVLPSYTRLGMAALLPHDSLIMSDDYKVYVDGVLCDALDGREEVLAKHCDGDCKCVQFDDIKNLKVSALREIFTGRQVVYVYHNQIDARGDKLNTQDEVFIACKEAIEEIVKLVHRLSTNANTYRFIVTADHGFIYKRNIINESAKIGGISEKDAWINRRYIVAKKPVDEDGVLSISMSSVLDNDDDKIVSMPISSNVFKVSGGGQNFVHGGSSPQEMIVPVLDVKMDKYKAETTNVSIALVSMVAKITNLITGLDFIQSEPVSDTVKETTYRIVFESEGGTRISNENLYMADKRESDSAKRIFRLRFNFKNQKYDSSKKYYLVVTDDKTGIELFRHQVVMDISFSDDFGW